MVAVDGALAGALELRSTLWPEAAAIVRELRARHVGAIHIISGDSEGPTRRLAEELGVERYYASTLPEEKAAIIDRLQSEGRRVCYVGDGINDSIALKRAHVSVSLRGASTIATDVATVVLVDESLGRLGRLFDIATEFEQTLDQSLTSTVIPGLISMGGVLFLGWGIFTTIAINQVGFALGFASSVCRSCEPCRSAGRWPKPARRPDASPDARGATPHRATPRRAAPRRTAPRRTSSRIA